MKIKFKSILFAVAALFAVVVPPAAEAAPSYASPSIGLPFATLAATTATNLSLGWNSTNSSTNIQSLYNVATGAFTNATNITTVITTNFAKFYVGASDNTSLGFYFTYGGSGTENLTLWLAPSVDGNKFDNVNQKIVTFAGNGTTEVDGTTNLSTLGYGWWQVMTYSNSSARTLTNLGAVYSDKRYR